MQAAIVDEAELGQLVRLVARLTLANSGRASSEAITPADHPGVLALLPPASLTARRSSRHLARKV